MSEIFTFLSLVIALFLQMKYPNQVSLQ